VGKGTLSFWRLSLTARVLTHWIIQALNKETRLHTARFAKTPDLRLLLSPVPQPSSIFLARDAGYCLCFLHKNAPSLATFLLLPQQGEEKAFCCLTASHLAPLGRCQRHQGGLYTQTAGYRATLGPACHRSDRPCHAIPRMAPKPKTSSMPWPISYTGGLGDALCPAGNYYVTQMLASRQRKRSLPIYARLSAPALFQQQKRSTA
jgi:hypothetical protein